MPFDPQQVEAFDVSKVPTLNKVIADIGAGGALTSLESSITVFKRFIEKIRLENAKSAKAAGGKNK